MKYIYTFLLLVLTSQAYSQPGKTCATASVMNVPDTMWEYCSYTEQGMVYQGAFNFDSTYLIDTATQSRLAWYKFTVPVGKSITACAIDFPASVMCSTYTSFQSSVEMFRGTNCSTLAPVRGGGVSYCYDSGTGNGIDAMWYRPAYFDSLVEGETYYLLLIIPKWKPLSMNIGIKWLPYFIAQYDCTSPDTIHSSPFKSCNLSGLGQLRSPIPSPQGFYNPAYYTIIPTTDTFTIHLSSLSPFKFIRFNTSVWKDCAHVGDNTIDSTTGLSYFYGSGDTIIQVTNATVGVPLTLVVDGSSGCGDLVYCPDWDIYNIMSSGIVMPLQLISFAARYNSIHNQVELNWQAEASEGTFVIEKSLNGKSFNTIGNLSNSKDGTHSYSFTDKNILKGKAYYRIRLISKDGKNSYSRTAIVEVKNETKPVVYPNPLHNLLNLSYPSSEKKKLQIVLFDVQGTKAYETVKEINAGQNLLKLNIAHLATGIYFVKLISPDEMVVEKVVIK